MTFDGRARIIFTNATSTTPHICSGEYFVGSSHKSREMLAIGVLDEAEDTGETAADERGGDFAHC